MTDSTTPPTSESTEPTATTPTAPSPDSFAAKLKAAREAAGLTQKQVGELAKVSSVTIGNWEHERSEPSPAKQRAVLKKLAEAAKPGEVQIHEQPDGSVKFTDPATPGVVYGDSHPMRFNADGTLMNPHPQTAATPEELAHDPHEPFTGEIAPDATVSVALDTPNTLPDIPVGNVHTSPDGVIRRRLADDDDRDGAELIDGRKWFTVGFVPPHPRASHRKATLVDTPDRAPAPAAPPAPIPAPQKAPEPRVHIFTSPKAPEPAEAKSEPAVATQGQRDWSWWTG